MVRRTTSAITRKYSCDKKLRMSTTSRHGMSDRVAIRSGGCRQGALVNADQHARSQRLRLRECPRGNLGQKEIRGDEIDRLVQWARGRHAGAACVHYLG
jgi:hypothetical protein